MSYKSYYSKIVSLEFHLIKRLMPQHLNIPIKERSDITRTICEEMNKVYNRSSRTLKYERDITVSKKHTLYYLELLFR